MKRSTNSQKDVLKTSFFSKYCAKPISYFVFILWSLITLAPLVWMAYSSFKTNAELTKNMYTLPEYMLHGSSATYEVIAPSLNVVYPKKMLASYGLKSKDFAAINDKILILQSSDVSLTPIKVHFFYRDKLPDSIKNIQPGTGTDKVYVNAAELPGFMRRSLAWDTFWWNYTSAWKRGTLGVKFVNSLIYTIVSTALVILLGLMLGYGTTKFKYTRIAAAVAAIVSVGYLLDINQVIVPLFLMMTKLGLTNTHIGVILVYTAFGLPLAVMLSATFIRGLPNSLIESAYIDGATPFRTFLSIIVPMTTPVIVTISIMTALGIWNEFMLVLVIATKESTVSLPVGIFSFSSRTGIQLGWQVAALIIATLPVLAVYFAFQKRLAEGVAGGAIKE